jgi:predicted O-linked N-acetylglucosamine transferase (SPINDLY family)
MRPGRPHQGLPVSVPDALRQAAAAFSGGRWTDAESLCRTVLAVESANFDALTLFGIIAAQTGRVEEAAELLRRAAQARPADAGAHNNYGNVLEGLGRYRQAIECYDAALLLRPAYAEAHNNRGVALRGDHQVQAALQSFDRALALKPMYLEAHHNRGTALQSLGRFEEAVSSYDHALSLQPDLHETHNNRGAALQGLGRFPEALASFERAIELKAEYAEAHNNRGRVLLDLRRESDAIDSFRGAIALNPEFVEAHVNCGNALSILGRFEEALESYESAVRLRPENPEFVYNCGLTLQELKRLEDALVRYDRALELNPGYAKALANRGNVLADLGRPQEAERSYERAIAIDGGLAEPHYNRGLALQAMQRHDEALESFDRALQLNPEFAEAWVGRGHLLGGRRQFRSAIESYDRAIALKPDVKFLPGFRRYYRMKICDWNGIDADVQSIVEGLERSEPTTVPFPFLALVDSPSLHRKAAEIWVNTVLPDRRNAAPFARRGRRGRIRVGYYSANFFEHAVAYLTAELFELHERSDFEIVAFSFGPDVRDGVRTRMERGFDQFLDVRESTDEEVMRLSRKMEIDIAVDLGGFTDDARGPKIFCRRVAPVQLSYIGYLGTMGGGFMDYLIADETIVPPQSRRYYAEKIIYLPSYQVNDSRRQMSERRFTREELGLPQDAFVYCCFNSNYKITPECFDSWMRILKSVDAAVLFLQAENEEAQHNLRLEAARRGVAEERLVFGGRLSVAEYLARYRCADLFLDTLPYNAGTTASDALWAGLPVLTCAGESFPARMAASILKAQGLPELIAETRAQYEAIAVDLATRPERLAAVRTKLDSGRGTSRLFDTRRFVRSLESAYRRIHERHLSGLTPDHLFVDDNPLG